MKQSSILKNRQQDSERRLREYRRRKSQLEDIRNTLNSSFEDCAWDISNYCRNVNQNVNAGIRLEGGSADSENLFRREEGIGDYNMSQSRNYVVAEINSVDNKISDLEREIARLGSSILSAERKEKEELRKRLERAKA